MFLDLRFNLINISGFFKKRNLWNQLVIYISSSTWFFIIFSIRSLFFVLCWPSVAANSRHHQLNPFVICLLLVVVAPSGGASCFLFLFSCWASPIRQCRWSRQRRINKTQRVRSRHPEKLTHFPCCVCGYWVRVFCWCLSLPWQPRPSRFWHKWEGLDSLGYSQDTKLKGKMSYADELKGKTYRSNW